MSEEQNNPTPHAAELRDALSLLVASAFRASPSSKSLRRYQELIRLYDMAAKRKEQGCIFAVYGSPNMGKSTLLNSLLGEAVLPVKPIPTTGSVIDLRVDRSRKNYEVTYEVSGEGKRFRQYRESREVCDFLNRYATQDSPFEFVRITGEFPKALDFLTAGCTLRDTPGAEVLLDGKPVTDERRRADSEKALASIGEESVPLFCVSSETIGQQQDVNFYNKYFSDRCCLHILTRIDKRTDDVDSQEALDAKNDFFMKFKIKPSDDHPTPVVCTGKSQGERFVKKLGLPQLEKEMEKFIDPKQLEETLRKLAHFILNEKMDFPVNEIYAAQLESILNQYTK